MESETEKLKETIDHLTNENASQKIVIANLIQRIENLEKPRPYSEVVGASGSNQTTSNTTARSTATPREIEAKKQKARERKTTRQINNEVLEKATRTVGLKPICIHRIKGTYLALTGEDVYNLDDKEVVKDRERFKTATLEAAREFFNCELRLKHINIVETFLTDNVETETLWVTVETLDMARSIFIRAAKVKKRA